MPNLRSFYPKDTVLYISSSTEEGLPFIPNSVINPILQGFIARAQDLYGQEICHFVMMSNHFHLILKVTDPDNVNPSLMNFERSEKFISLMGEQNLGVAKFCRKRTINPTKKLIETAIR